MKHAWQELASTTPFAYWFLDDAFDNLYKSEQRFQEGFFYSSALAGLLGLTAFSTEQQTKEIGIRKVLGASVAGLTGLLSKDFLKLVGIANIIAWPAAYISITKWLQNFAYRIEVGYSAFVLAGLFALIIAWVTVNVQVLKAALANPIKTLRDE